MYDGTQHSGSELLEFGAFIDLSAESFYFVNTTGGSGYTLYYED